MMTFLGIVRTLDYPMAHYIRNYRDRTCILLTKLKEDYPSHKS